MSALTVRQLRDYLNTLTEERDLDAICVLPVKTDMNHIFAFEEVCPEVTEMIDLGPAPVYLPDGRQDGTAEMRVLLIAPHSFHENEEEHTKQALN